MPALVQAACARVRGTVCICHPMLVGQVHRLTSTSAAFEFESTPLETQRRIVAYLDAIQERVKALKQAQGATEAQLKRLEQAILDKAFRGEL